MNKKIKISPLKDAATVILLKEENKILEVYLLKRSTKSGFMGGLYVFPGGHVDEQDKGMAILLFLSRLGLFVFTINIKPWTMHYIALPYVIWHLGFKLTSVFNHSFFPHKVFLMKKPINC